MSDIINVNKQIQTAIKAKIRPCYQKEIDRFFTSVSDISMETLNEYVDDLKSAGYSANTVNKNISALKAMIRILFDDPNLTVLQKYQIDRAMAEIKQVKMNKDKNVVSPDQILSPDEIEILKLKSPIRTALIIEFLHKTGCRINEALNIKLDDCKVNGKAEIRILGKGNKERKIRVSSDLWCNILEVFKGNTWLFESRTGNPINDKNFSKELRRLSNKHIQRQINPHMFRHTFATEMISRTGKIQAVSEYLGHSSTAITLDMYTHEQLNDDELWIGPVQIKPGDNSENSMSSKTTEVTT